MSMIVNPFWFGAGSGGAVCDWSAVSGATGFFDATAASLPGLADGGAVGSSTNWIDQVTGTRNFSQGTGADRPLLHTTGGPNSQPYISFDSTDALDFSNTISTLITSTEFTVFAVIRPQRNGVNDDPWFCPQIIGTINGFFGLSLRNAGGGNKFVLWVDRVSPNPRTGFVESATTFSQNVWYIVEAWYDGTDLNIKVNNDTASSLAFGGPGSLANTPGIHGALTSDLGGLYTANVDIGSTARDAFRACLGTRFGITLP